MSLLCNKNSMFKLCRKRSIFCFCSPVIFIEFWSIFSKINHWLNGEYHPGLHLWSCIFCCLVVYIWLLMELEPNPMSRIIPNNRVSSRFSKLRYRISNITKKIPRSYLCNSYFPSFFCYCYEIFCLFTHISYRIHTRGITKIPIHDSGHINIEDITLLEDLISTRNPMTDNIIEWNTGTSRISSLSPLIPTFIVYTSWYTSIRENKSIHDIVEFKCRDSSSNIGTNHIKRHSSKLPCFANSLYLFRGFYYNFGHFYDFSKNRFAV